MNLRTLAAISLAFIASSVNGATVLSTRVGVTTSTVTATTSDYSTSTITNIATITSTTSVCVAQTGLPGGQTCVDSAVANLGTLYYQNRCAVSLVGGTAIRAYVEPRGAAATGICVSICNALNNLETAASSCNGVVFTTVGGQYQCFLMNGPVTYVPAPASVFAVMAYATDPCTITSTTIITDTTETIETDVQTYTSIYESTFSETVTITIPDPTTSILTNTSTISSSPTSTASSVNSSSTSFASTSSGSLSFNISSTSFVSLSSPATSQAITNTSVVTSSTSQTTLSSSEATKSFPTLLSRSSTSSELLTSSPTMSSLLSSSAVTFSSSLTSSAPLSTSALVSSTFMPGSSIFFSNSSTSSTAAVPATSSNARSSTTSSTISFSASSSKVSSSLVSSVSSGQFVVSSSSTSTTFMTLSTALPDASSASPTSTPSTSASSPLGPSLTTSLTSTPSATRLVDGTSFMVEFNITYDGVEFDMDGSLVKRAANTLDACLSNCDVNTLCKATSYNSTNGVCTYFSCLYQNSAHQADGIAFASVSMREGSGIAVVVDPFVCDNAPSSRPTTTSTQAYVVTSSSVVAEISSTTLDVGSSVPTIVGTVPRQSSLTKYITTTYTVIACPSSVSDCPASERSTYLTTRTVAEELPVPTIETAGYQATLTRPLVIGYSTVTLYSTSVQTITACSSTVTNCPASERIVTKTDVVLAYTTVCPVFANPTSVPTSETPIDDGSSVSSSTTGNGINDGSIGSSSLPGTQINNESIVSNSKSISKELLGSSSTSHSISGLSTMSMSTLSTEVNFIQHIASVSTQIPASSSPDQSMLSSTVNSIKSCSTQVAHSNSASGSGSLADIPSGALRYSVLTSTSESSTLAATLSADAIPQANTAAKSSPDDMPVATSTALYSATSVVPPVNSHTMAVFTGSTSMLLSSSWNILIGIVCALFTILFV